MAGLEIKLQFTERQLSLVQDQYKQQGEEIGEFGLLRLFDRSGRTEYLIGTENKNKLLRDCQKAFTQVNVLIEKDLMDTGREDQLSKKEAGDLRTKSGSQGSTGEVPRAKYVVKLTTQSSPSSKDSIHKAQSTTISTWPCGLGYKEPHCIDLP
jgi:hypothetical protein